MMFQGFEAGAVDVCASGVSGLDGFGYHQTFRELSVYLNDAGGVQGFFHV